MPFDLINIGAAPNDGTGDPLRTAFGKVNSNFNRVAGTGARTVLGFDTTFYVRLDGNDGNSGAIDSSAEAFRTLQHALDVVLKSVDAAHHRVIIQLGAGTFTETPFVFAQSPFLAVGPVHNFDLNYVSIQGVDDIGSTVLVTSLIAQQGAALGVSNMQINGGIAAGEFGGVITTGPGLIFGPSTNLLGMIEAYAGGCVFLYEDVKIIGDGSPICLYAPEMGYLEFGGKLIIIGALSFNHFAQVENTGLINVLGGSIDTSAGSVTGSRFLAHFGGNISVGNALGGASLTFFPGSTPGECRFGGQYNGVVSDQSGNTTLSNGLNNDVFIDPNLPFAYNRINGPTGNFSISGFTAGLDGQHLIVHNPTAFNMTIVNDASSTAANRILTLTGADIVLIGTSVVNFIYSESDSRWIVTGTQG